MGRPVPASDLDSFRAHQLILQWVLLSLMGCFESANEAAHSQYTVVRGDTLFLIAERHDTTVADLKAINGLTSDLIEVDQVLIVPAAGAPRPASAGDVASPRRAEVSPSQRQDGLSMPSPETCLAPPSEPLMEHDMVVSEGISLAVARRVLNGHALHTLDCFDGYPELKRGTATLDIHVACTGVVSDVSIIDVGSWPFPIGECIAEKMRYADFPAHALPDGDIVRYPLTYTPPSS